MTNVLIVEDERNVIKGFQWDIASAGERYTCVGVIESAINVPVACGTNHVDLILMDINTKGNESGIAATENIKRLFPNIKVIVTTSYLDYRVVEEARRAGADSVWLKDLSPIELLDVMDGTMRGEAYFPEKQPDVPIGQTQFSCFTPTEQEVLYLLMEYISVKKIADKMCVTEIAVKKHLARMSEKVHCDGKSGLLQAAYDARIMVPKLKVHGKRQDDDTEDAR